MLEDRIRTKNNKDYLRELILPFIDRLSKKDGVLAILLLGGISNNNPKNHTDEFSDIDISVFYDNKSNKNYAPNFEFHLYNNNKDYEVNVHQMIYQDENDSIWDEGKKEAYSKAEFIFEKDKSIRKMINQKIELSEETRKNKIALLMGQYIWYVEINPIRCIKRGLYINGVDLLNSSINLYIQTLYLLNYQYSLHCKWRLDMAKDLKIVPKNYSIQIEKALITESISPNGIMKKRENIINLFKPLIELVQNEYGMNIQELYDYACKKSYNDRQLFEKTFADYLIEEYAEYLSFDDKKYIRSFINYYLISTKDEFLNFDTMLLDDNYKKSYDNIKLVLKNDKKN
jgi:hypothetical protein